MSDEPQHEREDGKKAPGSPESLGGASSEDFSEEEGLVLDEVDVRDLLRAALEPPPPPEPANKDEVSALLQGVQRRIRARSRGKFYADGWSTSRSPRSTYLITSIVMLALIALIAIVLLPWGSGGLP